MKTIIVKNTLTDIGAGQAIPITRICADSAVARDQMPLFVPDMPLGWYARVCPAYRVSRLGKHIPAKFARRYIDAVTAVCLLCATDEGYTTSGLASIIDSAVTTGRFLPLADGAIDLTVCSTLHHFDAASANIDQTIARISTATTLKSGDLIVYEDCGVDLPLTPGSTITAGIGGDTCLDLKVR